MSCQDFKTTWLVWERYMIVCAWPLYFLWHQQITSIITHNKSCFTCFVPRVNESQKKMKTYKIIHVSRVLNPPSTLNNFIYYFLFFCICLEMVLNRNFIITMLFCSDKFEILVPDSMNKSSAKSYANHSRENFTSRKRSGLYCFSLETIFFECTVRYLK